MNKMGLLAVAMGMTGVLVFTSCKPKQSAYKAAYEQARQKEINTAMSEGVTGETTEAMPVSKPRVTNEPVRTERVSVVEGEDANRLKLYSVVIGSFRNKTNAYSLKERMEREGYKVVLAKNDEGMLRVIVSSFDNHSEAVGSREAIKREYAPNFQDAWLLERTY
jgi:cell division protein FtsN